MKLARLGVCGVAVVLFAPAIGVAQEVAAAPMGREEAIARALAASPEVEASGAAVAAAEAGLRQAGRRPNPTLDIMTENVIGTGPFQGLDRAETTFTYSQPLEFGGDRAARRHVAEHDLDAAKLTAEARRLDLIRDVERAFVDAQAAEALRKIAEERLETSRALAAAIDRRVAAARDPLMAESRAQAQLASVEAGAVSARAVAVASRARLASFWGEADHGAIELPSFNVMRPPILDGGATAPELALATLEEERAEARIDLERARARPDPTVHLGARRFTDGDESAAVFGVTLPLSVFDRRTGSIAQARSELDRSRHERAARARARDRDMAALLAQLDIAKTEIAALDERALPRAEEALSRARAGYSMGAFSYLDLFDAQRVLTDARERRVSALRTYHLAEAELARLTGARAPIPFQELLR
jgi:cobalt-zinc-cadmium efflux system outer membrane protein